MKKRKYLAMSLALLALCSACAKGGTENSTGTTPEISSANSILNSSRVGYQIFVDTFANGDKGNDSNNISGDLKGIIDNLDYLKDNLNVEVLWLTPVHPSGSYHGYDVDDYKAIRDSFGGMEAYETLLKEAHKRNINVMLDLVINHTSINNEWFINSASKDPDYRDFYHWTKDKVTADRYYRNGAWYYALFWDGMPDLNYDNPKTYDAMLDVCKFWLDKGVDGFRVDGAKHIYNYDRSKGYELYEGSDNLGKLNYDKTLDFFNKLNKDLKAYDKDVFMTLEILENSAEGYYDFYEQGVDSTFDFESKNHIIGNIMAGKGYDAAFLTSYVSDRVNSSNKKGLNSLVLSNHDIERVMSEVQEDPNKVRACVALEMLMPGLSWIYSGDELGMTGKSYGMNHGDLGYRQPYKWGNKYQTSIVNMGGPTNNYDEFNKKLPSATEQLKDPNSLLNFYKVMTNYKANVDAFSYGDVEVIKYNIFVSAFTRSYKDETYLVLINPRSEKMTVKPKFSELKLDYNYNQIDIKDGSVTLSPGAIGVFKVK